MELLARQLAVMVMIAVLFVGAFSQQEVVIAQFEFLQAIQVIARNALEIKAVDALAIFVPLHSLGRCWTRHLRTDDMEVRRIRRFVGGQGR